MPPVTVAPESPATAAAAEPLELAPEQFQMLQEIADSQNIKLSDAINQAIGIAKVIVDVTQTKGERLLVQKGSQLRELTLAER